MFGRSKKKTEAKTSSNSGNALGRKSPPSVISADMNVLGSIISDGFIDIDGKVDGNVKCSSAIIRANGIVKGDVVADSVQIYGHVEGLVKAETVNLYHSAHVIGTIMHSSLTIEDGAFVDGKFKRTDTVFVDSDAAAALALSDESDETKDEPEESVMDNIKLISG